MGKWWGEGHSVSGGGGCQWGGHPIGGKALSGGPVVGVQGAPARGGGLWLTVGDG
jgi:hypothetical protein